MPPIFIAEQVPPDVIFKHQREDHRHDHGFLVDAGAASRRIDMPLHIHDL